MKLAVAVGVAYGLFALIVSAMALVAPQGNGVVALLEIGGVWLYVPLLAWVPLALRRDGRGHRGPIGALRLVLVLSLVAAVARFWTDWVSLPPAVPDSAPRISVTTWNLEEGEPDTDVVLTTVAALPPGVVAFEELTKHHAEAIAADPAIHARFPYQALYPVDGSLGIGVISSYPISDGGHVADDPPLVWGSVDLGGGQSAWLVAAHPLPGAIPTLGDLPIPIGFDPSQRDNEIATIRGVVDPQLAAGQPVILLGDFNTTDAEPAYATLSAGLIDTWREIGEGPGFTWRPDPIKGLPFGIIAIDHVFAGGGVRPASVDLDCTPRGSDHCMLSATLALP